ncbi:AMP-binding protein [[Mycobacterium] kokjensenii]|uniref:AMP-binding protein n=1 Tax=[Mycobacterium] kokjensenii TaxID=3064287 RepID=A0ABM9L7V4_9MYCO|nr:AMP-binding protein [Mycolicibacter sp. MU0083]CAJ1494146.1 AMP-binding protein [Mycolicibacter sp. MU0083]
MNLFTLLDQAAARFGDRGAVYHGERLLHTWIQLADRARRLATSLRESVPPGARIAIASENRPEIIELMFATWAADCVVVPLNYKLHPREMAQIVDDAGAALIFASPKLAPGLADLGVRIETLDSTGYLARFTCPPAADPDPAPSRPAWLFYTSGTTGRSKGAMLSHRNLAAMTLAHLADLDDPDADCSLIHGAPMSHGSGLYIAPYVLRGARQVVPASNAFDASEFLDLCEHHPGASAFLAPTMVARLVATGRGRPANLRSIIYGGGPMYLGDLKRAMAAFGPVFAQLYGQGEAPMTITGMSRADHAGDDAVLGSVGWPRSGVEVAVLRDDGSRAPVGEVGEIVCRGDVVMSGYWNNPTATAEALRDGWLFTGDKGAFDERGFLTLRDRSKDVVISGGSNIYPREVEEALLSHPGVVEAGVVGAPDAEWGEIVVAFVVGQASAAELDAHLLERIARFKRPKRYEFVDALPKNSYGKVLKRELRERLG